MSFKPRKRSLLDLIDFAPRHIRYLLDLAAEFKRAKSAGTEHPRLKVHRRTLHAGDRPAAGGGRR